MTTSDPDPKEERKRLLHMIQTQAWLFRSFKEAGAAAWLIPWPFGKSQVDDDGEKRGGNVYLTTAIVLWLSVVLLVHPSLNNFEAKYAGDCAKVLFTGSFLLGTILSVSVALPGQSLAKLTLAGDPRFAFDFVMPLVWGFVWGIIGALLMMFFPGLKWVVADPTATTVLRATATLVAVHGGMAVLNAILMTVRYYLAGMVLWSESIEEELAKKDAEADQGGTKRARRVRVETKEAQRKLPEKPESQPVDVDDGKAAAAVPAAKKSDEGKRRG